MVWLWRDAMRLGRVWETLSAFALRATARRHEIFRIGGANSENLMAERGGFEPPVPSRVHLISNQAPSTTRTPLPTALNRENEPVRSKVGKAVLPLAQRAKAEKL